MSHLPSWVLYRLSDVLFLIIFYIGRYRRKVVFQNIRQSFPNKSNREVYEIAREYYRHLCDLIFESIRGCSISREEVAKRHKYTNIELLNSYYDRKQSVTILGAHNGNWEWVALSLPQVTKFQTFGIFQQINNAFLNKVMKISRERYGMKLIGKKEIEATLRAQSGTPITMGYIADQSPGAHGRKLWMPFLGQDTAVTSGFEHFAKEFDTPVVYLNVKKVRRGFYECTFYPITDFPKTANEGEIVQKFMKTLEQIIITNPEYWLWSHRRWKLKKPALDKK